jgi:mannose-6-phosphate isomerase-like protein (cupin superfamily)
MANYAVTNLKSDVEDMAPKFELSPNLEARFARSELDADNFAVSYLRVAPNFRLPFGHHHRSQEELYVVVSGGGKLKLDDEVIDVGLWDAIRIPSDVVRNFEGGDEGAELLLFGSPKGDENDAEMQPGWWTD